jgi:DNA polymerase III alpha subunit
MSEPRFIHLRLHTEYSLLEGAVPVKKLIGLASGMDMPAVAVTDTNNMFAALEFSEAHHRLPDRHPVHDARSRQKARSPGADRPARQI